jgi:septum formation protein
LGIPFTVEAAGILEEAPLRTQHAERIARRLARQKAESVARRFPTAIVLAADTIVVYRGRLFGRTIRPETCSPSYVVAGIR